MYKVTLVKLSFQMWQFETQDHIFSSPVTITVAFGGEAAVPICDEQTVDPKQQSFQCHKILVGSHDHYLYCLDANGQLIWKYETNSPVYATSFIFATGTCINNCTTDDIEDSVLDPNTIKHHAVICSTVGQVGIVDTLNGKLVCSEDVPGEVFSSHSLWKSTYCRLQR